MPYLPKNIADVISHWFQIKAYQTTTPMDYSGVLSTVDGNYGWIIVSITEGIYCCIRSGKNISKPPLILTIVARIWLIY